MRDNAHMRNYKWDMRFLEVARLVASWSKDPSTKCGAVIVRSTENGAPKILSTGYNGFPRGTDDASSLYENREVKLSRVIHAELNAILQAETSLVGTTMYTYPPGLSSSCENCAKHMIQAGISTVVHIQDFNSHFSSRWAESAQIAEQLFTEAGVVMIKYPLERLASTLVVA